MDRSISGYERTVRSYKHIHKSQSHLDKSDYVFSTNEQATLLGGKLEIDKLMRDGILQTARYQWEAMQASEGKLE